MVEKNDTDADLNQEAEEAYTLRSEFARRTSHFASVSDSDAGKNSSQRGEVADIEETLRVIDSARRFLHNKQSQDTYHLTSYNTTSNEQPSTNTLPRDMSKETLKHGQSIQEKAAENANDLTQEVFQDDLQDVAGLKSNQSEVIHLVSRSHLDSNEPMTSDKHIDDREVNQISQPEYSHRQQTQVDDEIEDEYSLKPASNQAASLQNHQKDSQEILAMFEQQSQVHKSNPISGSPLRSLTPCMPSQKDLLTKPRQESLDLDQQIRGTTYISAGESFANSNRAADQHLYGLTDSLSPRVLDAEYEQNQAHLGDQMVQENHEKSHLYETGEQSDAIKSISKACQSISGTEGQALLESAIQDEPESNQEQITTQSQTPLFSRNDTSAALSRSHTAKNAINTSQSLTAGLSSQVSNQNEIRSPVQKRTESKTYIETSKTFKSCQSSERKIASDTMDGESDVKHKISLRYEKIELENKLAEMTKTIMNFKTACGASSVNSLQRSRSSADYQKNHYDSLRSKSAVSHKSAFSHRSSMSQKSRSPPKQIKPRAGKPRALRVKQKTYEQNMAYHAVVVEGDSSMEQTMINTDDEQTFRPVQRSKYEMPVSNQHSSAILKSHQKLVKEKTYDEIRYARREKEYKEVITKRDSQPYREYVKDFEAESRDEVRRTRFRDSEDRNTHLSQPPPYRGRKSQNREREDSQIPVPQTLPKLLTHETENIDGRYFAAMSPTNDSGALMSQRTGQTSNRYDRNGNLISCLRNKGALNSARDTDTFLSPRDRVQNRRQQQSSSQQPRAHLRRLNSHNHGTVGAIGSFADSDQQNGVQPNNFNEIMSPSSRSNHHRQDLRSPGTLANKNTVPFEQQAYNRENRRVRNINGFEFVQQIHDQMQLHQSKSGAPLSTDRSRVKQNMGPQSHVPHPSGQSFGGPHHNTQRSMGIESYCQRKEQTRPSRQLSRNESEDFNAIEEIQERGESLRKELTQSRKNRQEIEDNKHELIALRGENHKLRKQIEQKDLALVGLRDQNGEQKKKIDKLQKEVDFLSKEVETAGDQQLFTKYKEVLVQKEEIAQKMAQVEFSVSSNQKSHDLMQRSYEALKDNQLQLVEMNKKLIKNHQQESATFTKDLDKTEIELAEKSQKLKRYSEIIKTFDAQIEMFENFQNKSLNEMKTMQSQICLFQGLFEKEKLEKEELIRKLRPSQRPIHDSLKKQMSGQFLSQQTIDSNQDWQRKVQAFDSHHDSLPMSSLGQAHSSLAQRRRSSGEPAKLTQTMSKNYSFGQPFHLDSRQFGSGKSSKCMQNYDSNVCNSGRRNPHQIDLPLQILSENSSDEAHDTGEKQMHFYGGQQDRNVDSKDQMNQDFPPMSRKQDSSMGRARTIDQDYSYMESNLENGASLNNIQQYHTQNEGMPPRHEQWQNRQRSTSQNQMKGQNSLPRVASNKQYTDISQDVVALGIQSEQGADLDVSGYSVTANMQRVDKPRLGFISDQPEIESADQRRLSGCASAVINQRKLNFKKPRPASIASQKQGHNMSNHSQGRTQASAYSSQAPPVEAIYKSSKINPMSPKDYYCRLKEMQRRLDKARSDITQNVSRSRSKSPNDPFRMLTNQADQTQTSQGTSQIMPTQTSQLSNQKDSNRPHLTNQTRGGSVSGKSNERKRNQKSRQQGNHGPNQQSQPLYYTSLYNGVQPLFK